LGHVEVESFIKRHNFVIISTLISDEDDYSVILIWLYPKNPTMKEYVKFLATLSISTLIWGKQKRTFFMACSVQVFNVHTHPDFPTFLWSCNNIWYWLGARDHFEEFCFSLFEHLIFYLFRISSFILLSFG